MKKVQCHGINDMPRSWRIENEWNERVYRKWWHMLYRCYNENYHKTHPKYIGCTVCDRWLILSNFVEDVPKIDGYDRDKFLSGQLELDKDKKNDMDDKHYDFIFCTWLPKPENSSLANKGKQRSEETKQKMSESHKGKFGSEHPNSKRVAQYDKTTNELIKVWDSMMDVERELGIAQQSISKCCKGKYKSAGGFVWRYVEEEF